MAILHWRYRLLQGICPRCLNIEDEHCHPWRQSLRPFHPWTHERAIARAVERVVERAVERAVYPDNFGMSWFHVVYVEVFESET